MAKLKTNWTTGVIFAVVIAVLSAVTVYVGLNYAMPETLVVYNAANEDISVLFTDDMYFTSMDLMWVSVVFPAAMYLWMYGWYGNLAGKNPQNKVAIKKGEYGGTQAWIVPMIGLLVALAVWAIVSWNMLAFSLNLDTALFQDAIMRRQYFLVYGIASAVEVALYLIGRWLFKPAIVQQA